MKAKVRERMPASGEEIILQYFKCIDNKDVDGALELFDYDAVVYEPFSNVGSGLKGRTAIEPFLKVAVMANSNFKRLVKMQKQSTKTDKIDAVVTFERGDKTQGKFTFEFTQDGDQGQKKIRSLRIEF